MATPNYILALNSNARWAAGTGGVTTVTYSFDSLTYNVDGSNDGTSNVKFFNTAQRTAARQAMAALSAVANIRFVDVSGTAQKESANIKFKSATILDGQTAGYAFYPADTGTDLFLDSAYDTESVAPGTDGYHTIIHELGHTVGLKHPFLEDGDPQYALPTAQDNYDATMMSYTDGPNASGYETMFPKTPMIFDVATLQAIYGKNMATNAGDNRHVLGAAGASTLWDAGGVDWLSAAGGTTQAVINLNEGFDKVTKVGGQRLWLAIGSNIENAEGGVAADVLVGNGLANTLLGGGGNDTLTGGGGNDILNGGTGADRMIGSLGNDTYHVDSSADVVVEVAGGGVDTVISAVSRALGTDQENLTLSGTAAINGSGNTLANKLTGNAANNALAGGSGRDTLAGGSGNDRLQGTASGVGEVDILTGGVGLDVFVLGVPGLVLYNDNQAANAGRGDYALITDFTPGQDKVQFRGTAASYFLGASGVTGVAGTGLFLETGAVDELIAVVRTTGATPLTASNVIGTTGGGVAVFVA